MSPRAYSMRRRAKAVESNRERILQAAIDLYSQRGFRSTTVGDVAARADVARATVLNHFGGAGGLADAAVDAIVASLRMPTAAIFDGAAGPAERLRRLVPALFALYERGRPWFDAFRTEMPTVPALRRRERQFWKEIEPLYAAALGPLARNRRVRSVVFGLTSPGTLAALMEAGLSRSEAASAIADLLAGMVVTTSPRSRPNAHNRDLK